MGGFEGADHINGAGHALDMVAANAHDRHLDEDYARLSRLGILTLRESAGWRLCEPGVAGADRFDFSRVERFADAANRHGLQILWSLMHYGTPPGVSVLDDDFAERLADFAAAIARRLRPLIDGAPVYTPVNEISFLAWAIAETGLLQSTPAEAARKAEVRAAGDLGWEVKRRLVRAALAGIEAIRAEDPRARFLHVEPIIHVVPRAQAAEHVGAAAEMSGWQWQAWDMLGGRLAPELGGSAAALDLIGVNYYHNCQWEAGSGQRLEWHERDPRRVPFAALLRKAAHRYQRPLMVAETSHVGIGRAAWLDDVAGEIERACRSGVDVQGVCLYPLIDRPDWSDASHWHHSGLWDVGPAETGQVRRLQWRYARTLRRWQRRLPSVRFAAARPASISDRFPHTSTTMPHLIVFSHLRWNFVFQRPQHLLSRLAADFPVVFIEEPIRSDGPAWLERSSPAPGVEVLRPHTPVEAGGFHDDQLSLLEPLIADWLAEEGIADYAVWFYTPMALPLLGDLKPRAVIYDCMDELSAFRGAPRQMRQRETALMKTAQLVLTGGLSLYEAKRDLHPNVLCLPSAVDAAHYGGAASLADPATRQRAGALQGSLPEPRLGFFGVIDERLDIGLVAALADADPAWQIVMVGPVVKIDPASLPRRPNLHWLGQQDYALLPQLVAGWSVCVMPFALNESTRFISPTKTLEYMAAGKPVVSTPIRDVAAMFGEHVAIAADAAGFVTACREALAETADEQAERQQAMRECVAGHSWEATVATIRSAIVDVLDTPRPDAAAFLLDADEAARSTAEPKIAVAVGAR